MPLFLKVEILIKEKDAAATCISENEWLIPSAGGGMIAEFTEWYATNGRAAEKVNKNNKPDPAPISFQWFLDAMDHPEKKQPKKSTK